MTFKPEIWPPPPSARPANDPDLPKEEIRFGEVEHGALVAEQPLTSLACARRPTAKDQVMLLPWRMCRGHNGEWFVPRRPEDLRRLLAYAALLDERDLQAIRLGETPNCLKGEE